MRRVWWALAAVVAAVVGAALLERATSPDADPPVGGSTSVSAPAPALPTTRDRSVRERLPRAGMAGRDADAAGTRHLRVIATLPDGTAAAGAVVRFRVVAEARPRDAFREAPRDLEAELAAAGREAVADAQGCADVAVAPATTLCVRCGAHYGEAVVDAADPELRVVLQPDLPLCVQVVDDDGRPREGFAVRATVHVLSRREGERTFELAWPRTDACGMAVLPHAQLATTLPGADVLDWSMLLRCDLDPIVERAVDAGELRGPAPLRLRVPTGGSIVVSVAGGDGEGLPATTRLVDAAGGEGRGGDRRDGEYWFRQLPLGRRWIVSASTLLQTVEREVAGPTRVDDVVHVRIDVPERRRAIRGRIVRPDGVPVPQAEVRLQCPVGVFHVDATHSGDGSRGGRVGDFAFQGNVPTAAGEITGATLHVERDTYCAPTSVALPELRAGENDLGDVVVTLAPDEVPLASVEVRAGGRDVTAGASASCCGAGDVGTTSVESFAAARGDRITFHGPPTSRPLEVIAGHPGFLTRRVPVRRGEHTVVELEPAASLALHLLLPPVPRWLWSAELRDAAGVEHGSCLSTDEGFAWSELPPGRYALAVSCDGRVVHEVAALDLAPGDTRWPRTGAVDLRGSAEAFHVRVVAADGAPVEWSRLDVVFVGYDPPPPSPPRLDGWFVPTPEPAELLVVAAGCVPRRISAPSGDTVVCLQRSTTLRVHTAQDEGAMTSVRVVDDGVRDPDLRRYDDFAGGNLHTAEWSTATVEPLELTCVPGTIVEIAVRRGGAWGTPQRVAIGTAPVEVVAR